MKSYAFLAFAGLVTALAAAPAQADKVSLNEISTYLNAMKTAQGDFTQINGDGSIDTGKIYIKRPGRVRFEYKPPNAALVLASGGAVAIFDPKVDQGPETYPLSQTPLSIILAERVDLNRARMVTGHSYDGTATVVTAQDPEHPEYGNIQLKFTDNPVQLRQWIINDDAGGSTTVVLGDLQQGVGLRDSIFNIQINTEKERLR